MTLSDTQLERYARHIVLKEIGGSGQQRLLSAHAVIVGAGGIGSPVIQYLAAAGMGRITVIDHDRVDLSNLQRQTIYSATDIGALKVDAAGAVAARINPDPVVDGLAVTIDSTNAGRLVAGADVVVDGCDSFATRLAVAAACQRQQVPLVSAAVGEFDGQLAVYRGWEPGRPCYSCLVGADPGREAINCAETGVLGALTGVIGSLAALEAIRAVTAFGDDPSGKLLLVDALAFRFRTLTVPKDPGCPICAA